ncbi:MAG: hypothetical protein HRT36_08560 [Alphaproteobacteria bacterium]|nr:hypothetical protein [Alphaproteobacteria bacterium]
MSDIIGALPALHGELVPAAVQSFLWFIFIPFQQYSSPTRSKPSPFRRDLLHFFPDNPGCPAGVRAGQSLD